jgi:lambda family phage minor tail protein L
MSIFGELQKTNGGAWVELFAVDTTPAGGGGILYFHAGTNQLNTSVVWQGVTYSPMPISATGFEKSGQQLPRPKIQVANVQGYITSLISTTNDLIGTKVTRKRTMVKYLDAVNFTGGVNPTADVNSYLPDEIYYILQKTREDPFVVEFELGSPLDLQGVMIPRRQIISNICAWRYRGEGCGYSGGAVADEYDVATSNINLDKCSKKLSGCKMRFGTNGVLPYGSFPGAGLVR